jgi:hypothetical protein
MEGENSSSSGQHASWGRRQGGPDCSHCDRRARRRAGGVYTLGTNPPVPSQYMLSTWWFHVQNTNTFLSQDILSSFRIY